MADVLGVVAASWGVLMAISPILQIRRILQRKSAADVSIAYLAVLEFGFLLWMGYGVALGQSLAIETVAEGIETEQHAERMRQLGCTYGQGYYFAQPMTPEAVERAIADMPVARPTPDLAGRGRRGRRRASSPTAA